MRYEDLTFGPHPTLSDPDLESRLQRTRDALPPEVRAAMHQTAGGHVEQAAAEFPNGWSLSIVRGLGGLRPDSAAFDTCRFYRGVRVGDPVSWATEAEVQAEIDRVEGMPTLK